MKLILRAGGVLRNSPERSQIDDYIKRGNGLSGRCGFHSFSEQEIDLKKCKTRADETRRLFDDKTANIEFIALDERGKNLTSRQIANVFQRSQPEGRDICFVIGGADGFEPSELPANITKWSFGAQTWPHKLVRVMAAEQIYRALSILANTPYHRD